MKAQLKNKPLKAATKRGSENCGGRVGDAEWGLHPFLRGSIPLPSTNSISELLEGYNE